MARGALVAMASPGITGCGMFEEWFGEYGLAVKAAGAIQFLTRVR